MNGKGATFFKIAISVLVLMFLINQIYSMLYKPITTATAVYYETYSGIEIDGYFIRDETVIDYDVTGTERFIIKEGETVAKGGVIAEVYPSTEAATAYERIDEINDQIKTLEAINSVTDPSAVDLDTLSNRIERAYIEVMKNTDNGNFSNLNDRLNDLLIHINRKQMLTGEVTGFDGLLTQLKNELAILQSGLSAPSSKVTASASGYFVPQTDGLETVLTVKSIDTIDETIFDTVKNTKKTGKFGKIVSSQNCYIVATMQGDDYLNFSQGDKVNLKTTIEGSEEIKATVYKINVSQNKNSAVVVFSCNTMNGQLAVTRYAPMTIVTEEFSGIRVSKNSVRVVDGVTGVYIVQGSSVKFRPIEIIYSTDTFTLCKQSEDGNSNMIRLYDEVIEKGKNLYDGKYIG